MSLRDQLLKKGLVDKKRARNVERELKRERKQKQSQRQKKREVEAARAQEEQARQDAVVAVRQQARAAARAARDAVERESRLRHIALSNRIRSRGRVPFHHRATDGRRIHRLEVGERVAWKLRAGEAAIVALRYGEREPEYVVVHAGAAKALQEIDASVVVHLVTDTQGISAPDEAFLEPEWEISLRPRKATEEDVSALRAAGGVRDPDAGRRGLLSR